MKNVGIINYLLLVESLLSTERRNQTFYEPINDFSVTNAIGKIEVSMIFVVVTFFVGVLVWLTEERRLALFPADNIVRDPHHFKFPTRRCGSVVELLTLKIFLGVKAVHGFFISNFSC